VKVKHPLTKMGRAYRDGVWGFDRKTCKFIDLSKQPKNIYTRHRRWWHLPDKNYSVKIKNPSYEEKP
jgi:hypothetical protein